MSSNPTVEPIVSNTFDRRLTPQQILWTVVGSICYFAWFYGVVGLKTEHIGMYFLVGLLFFANSSSRQFLYAFAIFFVYTMVYDSLRVYPNHELGTVHIHDLYEADKALFGVNYEGVRYTLNELGARFHQPFFDVLAALFYINWVPVPLAFGFYLFLYHKPLCLRFMYAFALTKFVGMIIYYIYPAAPPWYVAQFGFDLIPTTTGNAAGLIYFDQITGIPIFENFYAKAPAPFAAMPSMHCAFPVVCFIYGRELKNRLLNIAFFIFIVGIWLSAVYTEHHYVLDVLVGGVVAVLSCWAFERIAVMPRVKPFFDNLLVRIGGRGYGQLTLQGDFHSTVNRR